MRFPRPLMLPNSGIIPQSGNQALQMSKRLSSECESISHTHTHTDADRRRAAVPSVCWNGSQLDYGETKRTSESRRNESVYIKGSRADRDRGRRQRGNVHRPQQGVRARWWPSCTRACVKTSLRLQLIIYEGPPTSTTGCLCARQRRHCVRASNDSRR